MPEEPPPTPDTKPAAIGVLSLLGRLLPGDRVRTFVFRNLLARPRKALRLAATGFYRMEHVYDVLEEFKRTYRGNFSILEFGTAAGYAFRKILYATRYTGMEDRVVVHGFDTFTGLPATRDPRDLGLLHGYGWREGSFSTSYKELEAYCRSRYTNWRLHRGPFEETLTETFLASLESHPPMLIWIDCDYYTSARTALERLLPHIPTGCVVYFDDYDFNFASRFTGEARVVHEINAGSLGEGVELVPDPALGLWSRRVYRFVRSAVASGAGVASQLELLEPETARLEGARRARNDSPFP